MEEREGIEKLGERHAEADGEKPEAAGALLAPACKEERQENDGRRGVEDDEGPEGIDACAIQAAERNPEQAPGNAGEGDGELCQIFGSHWLPWPRE